MPPRVFLSYSHDSPDHRRWAAELGTFLRENGVDAVLDQWDLSPGDDVTRFMEQGLQEADRVVVICTEEYIRKAEGGTGGVAYERMIVTAELVRDLGTKKFVPVVRGVRGPNKLPTFLGARLWIDLSDDCAEVEGNRTRLLKELHNVAHLEKPPLGKSPFDTAVPSLEADASILTQPAATASDPESIYTTAVDVAKRGDIMGWRQLSKNTHAAVQSALSSWRHKYEGHSPPNPEAAFTAVEEAVELVAPQVVLALAGVESGLPKLVDQRALLDDLLNFGGWPHSGRRLLTDLPWTIGFVYHGLHGAIAIATEQLDVAFALADMAVRNPTTGEAAALVQHGRLVGWPPSLGGSATDSWNFLASAAERWPWIVSIFGSASLYREALTAYYLLLTLDEFARTASTQGGRELLATPQIAHLEIPLVFVDQESDVIEQAIRRVRRLLPLMRARWARQKVPLDQLTAHWKGWIAVSTAWLRSVYPQRSMRVPYTDLM